MASRLTPLQERLLEPPLLIARGGASIQVDSPHEILVNKLCALLHRSEPRDVVDIKSLLEHGGDLTRALKDAPRKEAGFSPLTLAWLLRSLRLEELGAAAGMEPSARAELATFRDDLVQRLVTMTQSP